MSEPVTTTSLLRGAFALLDPLRWLLIGWTVVLTLVSIGSMWAGYDSVGALVVSVLGIVAGRALVLAALEVGGYARNRLRLGLIGLIVLQFLAFVGLALGALLFIVPFLVLLVRWWVAVPIMATEDVGPPGALARSWQVTAPHWQALAGLAAIVIFGLGVLVGGYVAASGPDGELDVLSIGNVAFEIVLNAATLFLSLIGASAFLAMRVRSEHLSEVFS